jgi:hypothetical protein
MKKIWQKFFFYSGVLLFSFTLAYVLFFTNQVRCLLVAWSSDVELIAEGVYVEVGMSESEKALLLEDLELARERIAFFFGDCHSKPFVIAGHTSRVMAKYGANLKSPGMNHVTPVGSYIVLGPEGLNVDVISHEICHAELMERVGWANREFNIPTWFDEGLALMLDYRYANADAMWLMLTEDGKHAPALTELENMHDFMRYTRVSPYLSYVTAMREVARWWSVVGPEGFDAFVSLVKKGKDFQDAYAETETVFALQAKKEQAFTQKKASYP